MSASVNQPTTTASRLTAPTSSAIAAIAVTGPQALSLVGQHLRTARGQPLQLTASETRFALWRFVDASLADEHVMILVRHSGCVEVHCHGGLAVTNEILSQLGNWGCTLETDPGFPDHIEPETNDADVFLALTQQAIHRAAESVLVRAPTLKTALVLLDQHQGALFRDVQQIITLQQAGQTDAAGQLCDALIARGSFGLKLINPWRMTLAGPPNVGKSSLMNALCGTARVLVHHEPGTTRDAIETGLVIGDWPLKLVDTAGIRATSEEIERQGIQTARSRWIDCDLGLLVVDATIGWTETHNQLLSAIASIRPDPAGLNHDPRILVVINKCDALASGDSLTEVYRTLPDEVRDTCADVVTTSATAPAGIDSLLKALANQLDSSTPSRNSGVPFTKMQLLALRKLRTALSTATGTLGSFAQLG